MAIRKVNASPLTAMDLKVGNTYRGNRPGNAGGFVNDRTIVYIGEGIVQFDGPAVGLGRHLPKIRTADFLVWANLDVTMQLNNQYQSWLDYRANVKASKEKK